jgi:hypothetical protein
MEYNDNFDPRNDNDVDAQDHRKIMEETRATDKGYNVIWRMRPRADGDLKKTKVEIYTSSGTGNYIRDAETGNYSQYIVGSANEDLFFKVILATGECKSKNGSSTLFYSSPHHYSSHLNIDVDDETVRNWEAKRDARLNDIKISTSRKNMSEIIVK